MATKIESTEITQQKKVFVKSEEALDEMEENGQLEPFTDYYTDDEQDAPFMPVGSIFASAIPQEDARVHLLDGSTISQDGVYADFANLIKALVSAGNSISCTQAQFNADVSATGNCGKFVIDDVNRTIRLPKITTFIQGLSSITDIGKSLEAGLPSITHTHPQYITANSGPYMGRQDYTADRSSSDIYPHVDTGTNSAVSPIYGKSNTVQPNATQFPYYIVLASGYKSSQVVNVDNVVSDINYIHTLLDNKLESEVVWSGVLSYNTNLQIDLSKYKYVIVQINLWNIESYVFCDISGSYTTFENGLRAEHNSDHRMLAYTGRVYISSDRQKINFSVQQYSSYVNTTYTMGEATKIIGVK